MCVKFSLGKAAIQAALKILLEQENIAATDIDKIIIAGAFGSYLDISNAVAIGLLPGIAIKQDSTGGKCGRHRCTDFAIIRHPARGD